MVVYYVIAAMLGAVIGLGLAALLGRNRLVGALMGIVLALAIGAIALPWLASPPRCKFGDPSDLPKLTHPAGYVYVLQDVEFSQRYKVGRTVNPKERLNAIRNSLPGESEIVAIIDTGDAPALEWQLHQRYAEMQRKGEWYDLSHAQVREICQI